MGDGDRWVVSMHGVHAWCACMLWMEVCLGAGVCGFGYGEYFVWGVMVCNTGFWRVYCFGWCAVIDVVLGPGECFLRLLERGGVVPSRVGITTDPKRRRKLWMRRVTGFRNWRIVRRFATKEEAQAFELVYSGERGSVSYQGGRPSRKRVWYVYQFNYSEDKGWRKH